MIKSAFCRELPKISVVIPAYNEEKFLPACLESLQNQTFDLPWEVIVVDNNSQDQTAKVAKRYGARVVIETKQGVCHARQRGAELAKGDIVVTTDADCTFSPDWLKNIYTFFTNDPDLVCVFGPYQFSSKPMWGRMFSTLLFTAVGFVYRRNGKVVYVGASNLAFRKRIWQQAGGYNTELAQGGDEIDLYRRLQKFGPATFAKDNKVQTSSRRLSKGLVYSFLVTFMGYYVVDYYLIGRLTGKSLTGSYPAYRDDVGVSRHDRIISSAFSALTIFAFVLTLNFDRALAKNIVIVQSPHAISIVKSGVKDVMDAPSLIKSRHHKRHHRHA